MPASRLASFLDQLAASELLPPAQLAEARRLAAQAGGDVHRLAKELLRRGWLTHYQINQVAAGRGKDLTVGPYRILDRLGEGSMGQVFKAHHQAMQRTVALKLIRRDLLARPNAVQRFYQEVRTAATLIHPNIVVAYDAGQAGGTHYFAMAYVDGVDLDRLVKESGPLPVDQPATSCARRRWACSTPSSAASSTAISSRTTCSSRAPPAPAGSRPRSPP